MPIYEYLCPKCQKIFEEWSHITENHPNENCPECGTPSPRIMSTTSFVLEGGGWYVTDYGYRKNVKDEHTTQNASSPESSSKDASAPAAASSASKDSSAAKPAASEAAPVARPAQ